MSTATTSIDTKKFGKKSKISRIGDVNEDLSDILSEIVPYLPTLTDAVALYSSASPFRDASAAALLEHLSTKHWSNIIIDDGELTKERRRIEGVSNNDDYTIHKEIDREQQEKMRSTYPSSREILLEIFFHSSHSATSCYKIKKIDLSVFVDEETNFSCPSMQARNLARENTSYSVSDNEVIQVCKWSHNLQELILDGCNQITETGLYHACVCLARNEFFTTISLKAIPLVDLKGLSLVKTLTFVDASINNKLRPEGLISLAELPVLKEILLVRCSQLGSVDPLAQSSSISKIDITACPISNIAALGSLRTLKWLKADATRIENGLSLFAEQTTSLEWLSIRNVRAPEEELASLSRIVTLKHLCIYNAKVETVDFLDEFSNIESLDIGMLQVRRADFRGTPNNSIMPQLTRLSMRFCPVIETIYMQKQWGSSLVFLDLLNASQLQDDGLENLGDGLPNLTSLNLAGTGVTDVTLQNSIAGKLTKLRYLDLSNTVVSSVSCLCDSLLELTTLKLECCRSFPSFKNGGGMKGLGDLPKLELLELGCTGLRDLSRSAIFEPWRSLKTLDLSGLVTAPKELVTFCFQCPKLRKLIVTSCNPDSGGFGEAVHIIRTNRYIEVEGM